MYKKRVVVFLRSYETRKYNARLLNVNYEAWVFNKFAVSVNTISERMRPVILEIDRTCFLRK